MVGQVLLLLRLWRCGQAARHSVQVMEMKRLAPSMAPKPLLPPQTNVEFVVLTDFVPLSALNQKLLKAILVN